MYLRYNKSNCFFFHLKICRFPSLPPPPLSFAPIFLKMLNVLNQMKNQYSDFYFLSYENILKKNSFQYKNDNISETNNCRNMDINFSLIFYNNLFILLHELKKKIEKWSNLHERCGMCWIRSKFFILFLFFKLWSFLYS